MPKISATIFFSLLLHIVFSNVGSDYEGAFVYWILYSLACGIIINYDKIEDVKVIVFMSIPSPLILLFVTYYRMIFTEGSGGCWLSGTECTADMFFFIMSSVFFVGSIFFIFLFSYLSDWIISISKKTFNLSDGRAKQIRNRIVWIGSVVVAVIGVVEILSHNWRLN